MGLAGRQSRALELADGAGAALLHRFFRVEKVDGKNDGKKERREYQTD